MWTQFLNQSRAQHKFQNKNLIILGSKHSGKRSLVDSLFEVSRTSLHHKRISGAAEGNKMRLGGTTTAVDYAYLNVTDKSDPDNRTHTKIEIYMIEEIENPSVYAELATTAFLRNSIFVIMLDFTSPWTFIVEVEKWVKFIYELQKMAQISIAELEEMARATEKSYREYAEPEFDEQGKFKPSFAFGKQKEEAELLPLPDGVLVNNIRLPFMICVNKCDLQSQVLREESNIKILVILYHLRSMCVKYGGSLIYTSIRDNCNINVLYEYILHRAYGTPLRYKAEAINEEAIFLPFGFDNPTLINDSVVNIDVNRAFNDVVAAPLSKKVAREEILAEEDSKFFEKYINQAQPSTNSEAITSEQSSEKPMERKKEEVTGFFMNLLQGGTRRESNRNQEQSQRLLNAEKELIKHTAQVERRNLEE